MLTLVIVIDCVRLGVGLREDTSNEVGRVLREGRLNGAV